MLSQIAKVFCFVIALGLAASPAFAQARSSSADITGVVRDPGRSVVRGATVKATNMATGLTRSAISDTNGAYRIPLLPPGLYEVKIEVNGFNTQIKKEITLTVGQVLTLNFDLALGSPKVLIQTAEPLIETERTHQSSTITQRPINSLPINGRNFLDFARLTPGVVEESPAIVAAQLAPLTTSGLSFAGQNGRANSVQIDGVDNNDIASNGVRPTISQEAVSEFQINRNGYNAEFGRAAGGVINIVSKGGANQFHGNLYNYFRNERLDARDPFASALQQDPPFRRNQPGFTFGGPIMKDRAFFFTAYEGLIRRESCFTSILSDSSILQPTAGQQDLIATLIRSGSPALVTQGQQLQALLTTAPDSPFPLNRNTYNLLASSNGAFPLIQTSSTGSVRLDYGLSEQDFIFLRGSLTNDSQHNIGVGGQFGPSSGHNLKFGADFSRYNIDTASAIFLGGSIDFAQLPISLGQLLGDSATSQLVSALSGLGRSDLAPVLQDGQMQPLTVVQLASLGFARSINQGFGNPNAQFDGGNLGLYLQDGFKARPNLYLSYGLRYDYDLLPSGAPRDTNNFGPRFGFAYDPFNNQRTVIRGGGGVYYQTVFTGLAFVPSVLQSGRISNLFVSADQRLTPISPTSPCGKALATGLAPSFCFYQQLAAQGLLTFPSTRTIPESAYSNLLGLTRATSSNRLLVRLAPDAVNGYGAQAGLGIDRQLGRDFNVSINYLFNRGLKLIRPRQVNARPDPTMPDVYGRPALTGRADPTRLADYVFETTSNSIYHGMAVSVNKRFSKHYQLIGSYTFSKSISENDDIAFELGPQDPTNLRADRALSSFDARHRLSLASIFESPYRGGKGSAWYKRALADFYMSPIVTARSGFPFNIQTGFDVNLDTNNNDRPVTVGRNTGIGPWSVTTDLRVGRRIRFRSDKPLSLELMFDAFNLFNRANFKEVNNITNSALRLDQLGEEGGVRLRGELENKASDFCGFTSAFAPRTIQLGAKLTF